MKLDKDMVSYLTRFVDEQNFRMDILAKEITASKNSHSDKFAYSAIKIIKQQNDELITFIRLFNEEPT